MQRCGLLATLLPVLRPHLVVCNLGFPARELYNLDNDLPAFLMLGSMGLASAIGLGLALNTSEPVIVLDGDGSLLMNLGTLATIANQRPPNLTVLAIDNGAYGSTGDQPTYTAGLTSLAEIARGAGFALATEVAGDQALDLLREALHRAGPNFIVAKVQPGSQPGPVIPLTPLAVRDRFRERLANHRRAAV